MANAVHSSLCEGPERGEYGCQIGMVQELIKKDYAYNLPQLGYKPEAQWGYWDLVS